MIVESSLHMLTDAPKQNYWLFDYLWLFELAINSQWRQRNIPSF